MELLLLLTARVALIHWSVRGAVQNADWTLDVLLGGSACDMLVVPSDAPRAPPWCPRTVRRAACWR